MIRLLPTNQNYIPVPDIFILKHMSKMSSTVIKIYLFLLYQFHNRYDVLDLDEIADALQVTESDVFRAIKHLSKANLLICEIKEGDFQEISLPSTLPYLEDSSKVTTKNEKSTSKLLNHKLENTSPLVSSLKEPITPPNPEPEEPFLKTSKVKRPAYSASMLEKFSKNELGDQLIFYTQTLFHKNLTANDLQILYSLHDWLGMSFDLIQFLISYCAENNHTRMSYVERVAINWHENHIETIEQAKDYLATYPSHYYTVLKAYGIYNLAPIPAQIEMIDKWTKEYLFPIETIIYACEKTILQTGKPELKYTDSILKSWLSKKLVTKEQILEAEANAPKKNYNYNKANNNASNGTKKTTFNNYEQRNEDYDAIEKKALEMRMKRKESKQ